MPETQTDAQIQFQGGMVPDRADALLGETESQLLVNVDLSQRLGSIEQIKGSDFYTHIQGPNSRPQDTDNLQVNSIYRFYKSDGTAQTITGWTDGLTYGLTYFDENSETLITSALTATITGYAVFQDVLYMVNGTGTLYIWDGTTLTTATFPTLGAAAFAPTIIEIQKNRAYYAGDDELSSTIIYSLPNDPSSFDSPFLDFVTVSDDDGDRLTALKQFGPALVAFKERKTYIIEGSPPQRISPLNSVGIGCLDQKTVRKTTFGLVFLGQRGLYLMESGTSVRPISENIRVSLQKVISDTNTQFSSVFHKNTYYLFYKPTTTDTISQGYAFDMNTLLAGGEQPGIVQLRAFPVQDSAVYDGAIDNEEWFACMAKTNNILEMKKNASSYYVSAANPTQATESIITTKWFDAGSASREKELYWLYVFFHKPTIQMDITLWIEHRGVIRSENLVVNEAPALWGTATWTESAWGGEHNYSHQIRVPAGIRYNRIYATFEVSGLDDRLSLDGLEWHYVLLPEV